MSTKISKDKHYSKHIIDTDSNDLDITNTATTNIKSTVESENLLTGSLVVDGGAAVKKTLRARNFQVTEDANIVNITTDNITINDSITFPDSEIYIDDLRVGDIDVNRSVVLNGDKHISFQDEEFYEGSKFLSWHSFTLAKGEALHALHPYSFLNPTTGTDVFVGESSHTIEEPQSSTNPSENINVAGIDKDGIYMPARRTQNNVVTANVVLEVCLNTYLSGSGASNAEASISIDRVIALFKDTDGFSSSTGNALFCTVEVLSRAVLIGTGSLTVNSIEFFGSDNLIDEQISNHVVNLSSPLSVKLSPLLGQMAYLRITLYNSDSSSISGPRFIGAYVDYKTNQITPS